MSKLNLVTLCEPWPRSTASDLNIKKIKVVNKYSKKMNDFLPRPKKAVSDPPVGKEISDACHRSNVFQLFNFIFIALQPLL